MAQNIATLAVKFTADTSGLKAGANQAAGSLKNLGGVLQSNLGRFGGGAIGQLTSAFSAAGPAGLALAGSLAAVGAASYAAYKAIEQFNASANRIDATSKLATRLDATYETMQRLTFVAERSGVPLESVAKAMEKMAREVGSGGESLDVAFAKQAKRIAEIEDPAKRAAEAYRVFGKSGTELIPMLKNIAADSERFARFNKSFGFGISDTDSQNVERMNDAWGDLVFIGTQLADKFVSKFGGPVADFLESGIVLLEEWADAFENSGVRWEDIGHIANNAMILMTQMVVILNNELKTTFYLLSQLARFSKLIGSVNPLAARMLSQSDSTPQDFGTRGGFRSGFGGAGGDMFSSKLAPAMLEGSLAAARIIQGNQAENPVAVAKMQLNQQIITNQSIVELIDIFSKGTVLATGGI